MNEETEDAATTPGKAAVLSTLILVGIYVIVATAAIAFGGAILLFVFVRSCFDLGKADAGSTTYFGIGSPLVIGLGFLVLGAILMVIWRAAGHPEFFSRRPEAAAADALGVPQRPPEPSPA